MTFVLMLGASLALAQETRIGIFKDNAGTICAVVDSAAGLLPVYVVQIGATGATGAQYKATKPACMTATYLSDTNPFGVVIGNSQTGTAVAYGSCLAGDIHVQTINFFASGTTPVCCIYPLSCDPAAGNPDCTLGTMTDCNFVKSTIVLQSGVVNSTAACTCAMIVPAQESSWGQIKALYGE
jgi:hypothetical protein